MTTTLYAVPPEKLPLIAGVCHEANRAYCLSLGDASQLPWDQAPDWQRNSACHGVLGILCNGNTPEQSHEGWMREKTAAGWKHGPVKDPEKLEHPCMVPYDQLPPEQQRKDHLFRDTCLMMARALGLSEVPRPKTNSCNRHDDCAAADAKAKAAGRLSAEHCDDDCCEDCFGN
jgi:RyR domain-containing protein